MLHNHVLNRRAKPSSPPSPRSPPHNPTQTDPIPVSVSVTLYLVSAYALFVCDLKQGLRMKMKRIGTSDGVRMETLRAPVIRDECIHWESLRRITVVTTHTHTHKHHGTTPMHTHTNSYTSYWETLRCIECTRMPYTTPAFCIHTPVCVR